MYHLAQALPVAVTAAALLSPTTSWACLHANVCISIPVATTDLQVGGSPAVYDPLPGEPDGGVANMLLPFARVIHIPPPGEPAREMYTDMFGCFPVESGFSAGHKAYVFPEVIFGIDNNIRIRGYADKASLEAGVLADPWLIDIQPLSEGDIATAELPGSDLASMLSLVASTYRTMEALVGPLTVGAVDLKIRTHVPVMGTTDAALGGWGTATEIFLRPELVAKKFVIGHEAGHSYQGNWNGYPLMFDWGYPLHIPDSGVPLDTPCQFGVTGNSNSVHGIRSAEYTSTALVEGFAQFVSTTVFDSPLTPDAVFKYYKDIDTFNYPDYVGFVMDGSRVAMIDAGGSTLGGTSAWVENSCPSDWINNENPALLQEVASEMDWQRFFWQFAFWDDPGLPPEIPTMAQVLDIVRYTFEEAALSTYELPTWSHMETAILSHNDVSEFYDRFQALSAINGLTNGGTYYN